VFALFPISFEHSPDIPFTCTVAIRTFQRAFAITFSARSHICFPFVVDLEHSQIADFFRGIPEGNIGVGIRQDMGVGMSR